jgi:hypothetical protein
MLRSPNLSPAVTSSTQYDRVEAVALGFGGAMVFEFWDFDRNRALLSYNPQAHLGFFLSELPRADLPLPRLSIVAGIGARLLVPGSDNSNTNLRTVLWFEWSKRQREQWRQAILAGFAVNFGAFPN